MKCSNCHYESPVGMKFCGECGAELELVCSACKTANPPNHKFCGGCGKRLVAAAEIATAQGSAPSVHGPESATDPKPSSYTPKHLAERILNSRVALEGERKHVTVLFADLKGSTELIQGLDPEETRSLLDAAVQIMMDGVHAYEGTVNQTMGDGIMALFGAPLAHEDHAVRACYAALAMQAGIRRYAEETMRLLGVPVRIRVGLNSGEVVVRSIANDLRMDYSAIGPTTHLAARMEQNALDNSTFMTPETYRLVEEYVQAHSIGRILVKGVPEPMEVFELDGTGRVTTRLQASQARGLTRFVGRERELAVLNDALHQAAAGKGQMVVLIGEAGTGKSRLVWEITQSAATEGWLVAETGSTSYGKTGPYLPVIDMLRRYCGIEPGDDAQTIRQHVMGKLRAVDEALLPSAPAFLSLLDVVVDPSASPAEAEWQSIDPPQRRRRTQEAITALLVAESRQQPLLLVVEDEQLIDAESRAVIDRLAESLRDQRMMLLLTYRQEQHQSAPSRNGFTQLLIEALPPRSADELLGSLMGRAADLAEVKEFLIERTRGNPFFLEELVRTMIETGVLDGARGAYRLAKPLQSVQVPASVQAVLSTRIDRLLPDDKRQLQSASVIGKHVPHPVLEAISDVSGEELDLALGRLQAAQFMYQVKPFPEPEYTFEHDLTREVAYEGLLMQRRRTLHAQIVEAIERLYPERLAEHVDRLAYHALSGDVWHKAVDYYRQAANKAAQTAAYRAAIGALEQALVALEHLPDGTEKVQKAVDIRLDLRGALMPVGEWQIMHDHLLVAKDLATQLGDQERLARVYSYLAVYYAATHDADRAVESGECAARLAQQVANVGLQVSSTHLSSEALYSLGDFQRSAAMLRRNVTVLEGELRFQRFGMTGYPAGLSRALLLLCLAELGDFDEATAVADEAVRLAEEINQPFTLALTYSGAGFFYLHMGKRAASIRALTRAVELCGTWNFTMHLLTANARLGYALVLADDVLAGLPLLEQAVEKTAALGGSYEQASFSSWLSDAYLRLNRTEDAITSATHAHALATGSKQKGKLAHSLRMLGAAHAACNGDPFDRAESLYAEAFALAGQLGMRPLQAHCQLGLGQLRLHQGRSEDARQLALEAFSTYSTLGMQHWLQAAPGEVRELTKGSAYTDQAAPESPGQNGRTLSEPH
jgi:class 3 adenylate cyclase/tetratricopeptide (TPR) repeat protein